MKDGTAVAVGGLPRGGLPSGINGPSGIKRPLLLNRSIPTFTNICVANITPQSRAATWTMVLVWACRPLDLTPQSEKEMVKQHTNHWASIFAKWMQNVLDDDAGNAFSTFVYNETLRVFHGTAALQVPGG